MTHEYIGKPYKDGHEICMVIDTEIATGDALVYNRHTNAIEVIPYRTWINVGDYFNRMYQDTEASYEKDYQRACKKYAEVIKAFEQRGWQADEQAEQADERQADEQATDTASSVLTALESAESREAATEYLKAQKLTKAQVTEISRAAGVHCCARDSKKALMDRLVETVVGMRLAHEALLRVSW